MTERAGLEVDTLTIRIPMRLQRRGGRKLIMTPEGAAVPTRKPRRDETLVKALVRAHRWRRRIESGQAKSITDLAEQEGVTDAYVCRLLPLTCLAPDIVEAILDGRQPKGLRLAEMLGNGPASWEEQRVTWCSGSTVTALAAGLPKLRPCATWLDPARLSEPVEEVKADRQDHSQHCEITEAGIELGHELEVHAVDASDRGGDRENCGPAGEALLDVTLTRRLEQQAGLERERQDLAQHADALVHALHVIHDVAKRVPDGVVDAAARDARADDSPRWSAPRAAQLEAPRRS